jgi:dihydroneopterin aldolase
MSDKAKQQPASSGAVARGSGRPPRRVFVRDLELLASVGIFEIEKRYEQRVIVSLELDVTDDYDGMSDRLDDVLDYGKVAATAERVAQTRHFHLLETMAERIAEGILADSRVQAVRVRIEKPDILPGCRSVGIEIERFGRNLS